MQQMQKGFTSGRLVAPTSSTRRSAEEGSQPSIWTSISVFSRRLDSCSPARTESPNSSTIHTQADTRTGTATCASTHEHSSSIHVLKKHEESLCTHACAARVHARVLTRNACARMHLERVHMHVFKDSIFTSSEKGTHWRPIAWGPVGAYRPTSGLTGSSRSHQ